MARSYLAAIGTVILAVLISCPGANAQFRIYHPEDLAHMPKGMQGMPRPKDQDRMACEASLQAYDEQGCDKNCSDDCKSIGSDLSKCKNIGKRSAVVCKQ